MIGNNTGNTKHILLLFLPKPTFYFSPWQIICNGVKSGLEENENVLILANLKPSNLRQHSTYHPDSWFWFSHKRSYISPITTLIPSGSPKENPPIAILKLKCCSKRNSQLPLLVSTCFDGKLLLFTMCCKCDSVSRTINSMLNKLHGVHFHPLSLFLFSHFLC